MPDWIYDSPLGTLAVLTAITFVGVAWLGTILIRPILRILVRSRSGGDDAVGNVLSSFGVLYGILLGLTAVAAYQNWSQMDTNVTKEASTLISLYQSVSTYPEPHRQTLRQLLREVGRYEIEEEWPLLKKGISSGGGRSRIVAFEQGLLAFEPQTKTQEIVHAGAIQQFTSFLEQRRLRIYSAGAGIPASLWYVVIIGAIINMLLVWALDTKFIAQLFLGGLLAYFLGAMILLIAILDKPFKSQGGVSPDALKAVHQFMMKD